MKWSASDYLDENSGSRYQVYAKVSNEWMPFGRPTSLTKAREEVRRMQQEGRVKDPHFVPL